MLRELPDSFYPVTHPDDEHERRIAEEQAYYYRALDIVSELCQRRFRAEPEASGYWISRVEDVLHSLRHEVEAIGGEE